MDVIFILLASILLQLTAAGLALRLMGVTGRRPAWALIAVALVFMTLRRIITFYQWWFGELSLPPDPAAETVALLISALMVGGIAWIAPMFLSIKRSEEALQLNESRLQALWELSHMTIASLQEITDFALDEGVRLTKSENGFLIFLNEEETAATMQAWSKTVMDRCSVTSGHMTFSIDSGGIWAEAVRLRQPLIVNDYGAPHPAKKGFPPGHAFLRRVLAVPVFQGDRIVLVTVVANKKEKYDEADVRQLTLMMHGTWWHIQRRRAEDALTAEVERGHLLQAKLVQTSIDGIVVNDMDGNVLIFNEGASRILGYKPEEVISKVNVGRFYPPNQAHAIKEKIYDPAVGGGVGILENYETEALHQDGSRVPIWLSAQLLYENGKPAGIVGYFRDLRERKRMEEELLRHERLASLGKMVAHITHEVKNPLTVIGGFAHQLERLPDLSPEARRKLCYIHEEMNRLENFLVDLGSFTRAAPPKKVTGDLVALVREVAEMMQESFREKGVVFQLQATPDMPPFAFDPGQIRQVLINLVKNALEAMPQGGNLLIKVGTEGPEAVLAVADTGVGIAPEHLKMLFTPFFSTKEKGTGLGLVICRGLIEQHQGAIAIDSQVGRGSTVTIRLPLSAS
jgi:PAS domain S-box-containing protein